MIDEKRIADIRERCEGATPGPWRTVVLGNTVKSLQVISHSICKKICSGISPKSKDADFIVNAREDIPYLLDTLAELQVEYDKINDFEQSQCAKLLAELAESRRREQVAIKDLEHWKICATCALYKNGRCTKMASRYRDKNYVGCKSWQWRGLQEAGEQDDKPCKVSVETCKSCDMCHWARKRGDTP